ncbi:Protein SufA [Buchnera aphidicola (Neophyllaphis podocarpi)]|uniref:HesB/IscA family protein n=1 Tax=Buchnera aphidicola TaxID=9 RepID=UPI0031B7F7BB
MKKIESHKIKLNQWKGIQITSKALKQILYLTKKNNNQGIRINIKKSGCAGFRYTMELAKNQKIEEIKITYEKISIFIPIKITNIINGTKIDFIKEGLNKTFKFENPKITQYCGCGESFNTY